MKNPFLILISLTILLIFTGCSTPMTGRIVDAETGQPIEGAIVLVEWTKTHGFGNTYTSSEKVVEIFSDKDGIVKIPEYNDLFAEEPDITIYKPGYVAWNNHWIFPSINKREDFEWKDNYVIRLEKFKESYSYVKHNDFINLCIHMGLSIDKKRDFIKTYEDNEGIKYRKELLHE
jgi:hypothetical protein